MRKIVGIHGVGSPQPGAVIKEIADGFRTGTVVEHGGTLRIEGQSFRQATFAGDAHGIRVIEVNWADLKGFPTSRLGLLFYVLKIFIAMWQISSSGWRRDSSGQTGPLFAGKVLHFYFAAFAIFLPPVSIMIMFSFIFPATAAVLMVVAIAASLAVVAMALGKFDKLTLFGLVVTAAGVATSLTMVMLPDLKKVILVDAIIMARIAHTVGVTALVCAVATLLWRKVRGGRAEGDTWTTFVTRCALLILPFAIVTGGYGAAVAAAGFYTVGKLKEYYSIDAGIIRQVGELYCNNVGYNVAFMELVDGVTTGIVGLFLVLGVSACLVAAKFPMTAAWQVGRRAQDVVLVFLWLVLAGCLVVLGADIAEQYFPLRGGDACGLDGLRRLGGALAGSAPRVGAEPGDSDLMTIYMASSLRLVPWLGLLVGPLRIITNIVADVLCYVLPKEFPLSIAWAAKQRLRTLLDHIDLTDAAVVAHSQGTVVAHDVLSEMGARHYLLITAGSPLCALYQRFLNITPGPLDPTSRWVNFHRSSDYIAGDVRVAGVENRVITSNYGLGHFGYFREADILRAAIGAESTN